VIAINAVTKALALSAVLLASVSASALAEEEVVLKGIHVGMTEQEYDRIVRSDYSGGRKYYYGFTLADISGTTLQTFEHGVLVSWHFRFAEIDYEQMRDALKSKYTLECEPSEVQTHGGAAFRQEECFYMSGDTVLSIRRFSGDIRTSSLVLHSASWLVEKNREEKMRSRDDL
jgi:hypothetical protein